MLNPDFSLIFISKQVGPSISVVLNLGSIESQGFVELVSGVRQRSTILILFSTFTLFGGKGHSCFVGFFL